MENRDFNDPANDFYNYAYKVKSYCYYGLTYGYVSTYFYSEESKHDRMQYLTVRARLPSR